MARKGPEQPTQPHPTPEMPEGIRAKVSEFAKTLRRLVPSPAQEIAPERSGQLSPSHTPDRTADGDASGAAAKGRHPAAEIPLPGRPLPSPGDSLRDRSRFLPPASGRGRGGPER